MAPCSLCGAEGPSTQSSCEQCGARWNDVPELDLTSAPQRAVPVSRPRPAVEQKIELAYDPRSPVPPRPGGTKGDYEDRPSYGPRDARSSNAPRDSRTPNSPRDSRAPKASDPLASDARLLAHYGEAPSTWIRSPFYAYRVLRRRQELRRTIVVRGDETTRADTAVRSALVELAERIRPQLERQPAYSEALSALGEAERHLRSRDLLLAAENDEQSARLSSIDAHLAQLEAELTKALKEEQALGAERERVEATLSRHEANAKKSDAAHEEGGARAEAERASRELGRTRT